MNTAKVLTRSLSKGIPFERCTVPTESAMKLETSGKTARVMSSTGPRKSHSPTQCARRKKSCIFAQEHIRKDLGR